MDLVVNVKLLRRLIKESNPLGKEKLALKMEVPVSTLEKMLTQNRTLREATRNRISKKLGMPVEEIFLQSKSKTA